MEETALSVMGMMPNVFWELSFRQFTLLFKYHKQKSIIEWEHTAYLASVLMNIHKNWKKPLITVDKLLNRNTNDDYANYVASVMLESDDWMEDGWQPEEVLEIDFNDDTKEVFK